jgi:hypothetical protein
LATAMPKASSIDRARMQNVLQDNYSNSARAHEYS